MHLLVGRLMKNDGLAEVKHTYHQGWLVIINHYEGTPEIWGKYIHEEEANQEAETWNSGRLGDKRNES